jgi:hypothetical protein
MANKVKQDKFPVDDTQPEIVITTEIIEDDAQPIIAASNVAPGYVELKLKSGKGKSVVVPKHTMKFYPEDIWEVVAEGSVKKK